MTDHADLRDRFHRADRLHAPDIWPEAMERASVAASARTWRPWGSGQTLRMALLVVALLILASAAIAVVGALLRTPRPAPPASGWIAYTLGETRDPARGDIYLTSLNGTPRRIVGSDEDGLQQGCPAFSPDGRYLAYAEKHQNDPVVAGADYAEGAVVILELDANGAPTERLRVSAGRTAGLPCPLWSPDSRAVAFLAEPGVRQLLRLAALDGPAVDLEAVGSDFAWTHDSAAIAVLEGSGRVRIVPTDGAEPRVLDEDLSRGALFMSASPSGPMVAVGGDWGYIRVLDYETGRVLFDEDAQSVDGFTGSWGSGRAAWSLDGTRLAWELDGDVVVRAFSAPSRTIRPGPWIAGDTEFSPASGVKWSADGTRLLFVAVAEDRPVRYAFVSITAEGPANPLVLTPWTDDLYWLDQSDVTWQALED